MSNKRKSFIIHIDSLEILDKLTDDQAGKLFRAIKAHHAGEDLELDLTTDLVFTPFKSQFERDDERYDKTVERNRNNGLKGGRPKTQDNPEEAKKPSGLIGFQEKPKKADSDSKSDSKSDSVSEKQETHISPVGDVPADKPKKQKAPAIDYTAIKEIWNTNMTKASAVTAITDKRKRAIKKLFDVFELDLVKFENYVNYVNSSPKCQWMFEEQDRGNGQVWQKKGFDYITSETCFLRVKEEY